MPIFHAKNDLPGSVLGVLCFISFLSIELYGVYVLATVCPKTEKRESCPIFAMILTHVCALVVIPAVAYAFASRDDDWGDSLSMGCVCVASLSAFMATLVIISNKVNVECADGMVSSLIAFVILDLSICIWSSIGWAIIVSRINDHAIRLARSEYSTGSDPL